MSKSRRRRKRFQRQTTPGSAPGLIAVDPHAPAPRVMLTAYGPESSEQVEMRCIADVSRLLDRRRVLWADVQGLGDAETIRELGRQFGLHPLALEDVVNVHQQVKVEDYGDHLFFVGRRVDDNEGRTQQVSMFLGDGFLVTFQEGPGEWLAPVCRRLEDPHSRIRSRGADFLAYAVLDVMIDGYFPLLEHYGERLDTLEDWITSAPPRGGVRDLHEIRSALRSLRRMAWSHREALNKLLHDSNPLVGEDTRTFLRDCYDHTLQIVDLLEIYHETCIDLREVHLSTVSNRLNEIMKVLTIIATIFIPLSFIASLYGMNFNTRASPWNMPELNWFFGYPFAIGLMIVVACCQLLWFWTRGWLRRDRGD